MFAVWNPGQATGLLDGLNVEEWRIASTLCAQQRSNRCAMHFPTCGLRGTAPESLKFRVSCAVAHRDGPESVSELQHLCASLQDSGLLHGDCDCAACYANEDARRHSDMETDAPQPFMLWDRSSRRSTCSLQ